MNKDLFRKILPHLIAVFIFLIIAVIYCKPALEGQVLQQSDITGWKGAMHQSNVYAEKHGNAPLWTNSLFSGMPAFQIGYETNNYIPGYIHNIMTLWLPAPIQYFFLACICFYILCLALRINPYVGIMGSLAFAYATYNPVIISVGHVTKMLTMAYMPALLGSVILIYEKRYWLGAALTAAFTAVMIAMNHPQIAYYFFIALAVMTLFYVISWIKEKEWKHLGLAIAFTGTAAITGVLTNAVSIMSTYEYQKETIRGGTSALTDTNNKEKPTTGLDKGYAMSYSMNIAEPFVMMIPRMYGGSSGPSEVKEEKSKAVENYMAAAQTIQQSLGQQMPPQQAQQYSQQVLQEIPFIYYWGGMTKPGEVGVTGPPYVGAIICFLAILAMFIIDKKYKWWVLTVIGLTIVMSWGSYFREFNSFLLDYLPLYNKFRAPSMIMVIPQLLLPMLAALCVNAYIAAPDKKMLWVPFKKGLIATGITFLLLFLLYFSFDFLSKVDLETLRRVRDMNQPQVYDALRSFADGLIADRKSLFMGDIWRSFGYIGVAALTLFLLIKNKIRPGLATFILTVFVFIDLIIIDVKYLNKDNYQDEMENEANFNLSPVDNVILADTSFYRVFNIGGDAYQENTTSYHYNSIGGYHPAKLRIYQDIIETRLSQEQNTIRQALGVRQDSLLANTHTLNMLNAKYFIYRQGPETKGQWRNPNALGNVWFVDSIMYVKDADAEINALNTIDPKSMAVVQESFKSSIPSPPQPDSAATISLVKNDNDVITYTSGSNSNQFAVFSEVYYKAGWKAFIDGKEAPIVKVNYVLRGLAIPSGNHMIEFRFEPQGYLTGKKLTSIFSIVLLVLLIGGIFMEWRERNRRGLKKSN